MNQIVISIVLGNVRKLRTTLTMEIYMVSLLPPSVPKSPIAQLYGVFPNIIVRMGDRNLFMDKVHR